MPRACRRDPTRTYSCPNNQLYLRGTLVQNAVADHTRIHGITLVQMLVAKIRPGREAALRIRRVRLVFVEVRLPLRRVGDLCDGRCAEQEEVRAQNRRVEILLLGRQK